MTTHTRTTACNRDCPDCCTLVVDVDSSGRAVRLRGSSQDPVTRGFLCERTSRFLTRQYAADRLTRPLWRPHKGAPLQEVSWEFALDFCAQRLLECRQQSGPESILHYRSGGSLGLLKMLSDLLFEQFGPVCLKRGDICSGAGEAAQETDFGICDSHQLSDLANSRHILLWGKNVHTSGPHLLPILLEARSRGAKLYGIDPVRTRQSTLVDHFIQPHPGCDFALVMAICQGLLATPPSPHPREYCDHFQEFSALVGSRSRQQWAEQAGCSQAEVDLLQQALAEGPAAILVGWGMGRRANGGAAIRALDALSAVSGNLGRPGGGCSYYYRRRSAFDGLGLRGLDGAPRSFAEACLGQELLQADPPVRVVWVTAGNPATMLPDSQGVREALARTETLIVVDTHPTATTELADVVLPTLTLLEDDDLLGAYGNHYLRVSQPALEPAGEARHELWIWQQMAERIGLGDLLEGSPRQWKERMTRSLAAQGISLDQMMQGPLLNPLAEPVLFADLRFPTESGKMQLVTECPPFPARDAEYPLQLAAFSTSKSQASQWAVEPPPLPLARLHPQHGRKNGPVWLETRQGRMKVELVVDERVHPHMIVLEKGDPSNALITARETDLGGGAVYYEEPARLVD